MIDPHYPNGKLNDHDEGELTMAITEEKGNVMLRFPKPVEWIGMPPEQAIGLAMLLIQHAKALQAAASGKESSHAAH